VIRFRRGDTCLWLPPDAETLPGVAGSPAILFLHGVGERGLGGAALDLVARWGLAKLRLRQTPPWGAPQPFLVVAPQCPPDRRWGDLDVADGVDALLDELTAAGEADPGRLCLAGFSMGGIGAYDLALRWPDRFAVLVSVCGACEQPWRLAELAHLSQWVAWADDDEIARLTIGSRDIVARLSPFGRLVARSYRVGPEGGIGAHPRTADAAFAEPDLHRWLIEHVAGREAGLPHPG